LFVGSENASKIETLKPDETSTAFTELDLLPFSENLLQNR